MTLPNSCTARTAKSRRVNTVTSPVGKGTTRSQFMVCEEEMFDLAAAETFLGGLIHKFEQELDACREESESDRSALAWSWSQDGFPLSATADSTSDDEVMSNASSSSSWVEHVAPMRFQRRRRRARPRYETAEKEIAVMKRYVAQRRRKLSLQGRQTLANWFEAHIEAPYPDEREKKSLMRQTGLSLKQIHHWFTNRRKRDKAWRSRYLKRGRGRRPKSLVAATRRRDTNMIKGVRSCSSGDSS